MEIKKELLGKHVEDSNINLSEKSEKAIEERGSEGLQALLGIIKEEREAEEKLINLNTKDNK